MTTSQGPLAAVVRRLRTAGTESSAVEARAAVGGFPRSAHATLSAFSNGGGGLLILGLDESSGFCAAQGFDAATTARAASEVLRPRRLNEVPGPLAPSPVGSVDVVVFEGSAIVLVDVDEMVPTSKPCFVTAQGKENGSYERLHDGDHRMSTYSVFMHTSDALQPADDERPVGGATPDHLDPEQVERFVRRLRRTGPRAVEGLETDAAVLERNRVVTASGTPTVAGILALGRYPQQFFPQLMVTFASFPGASKSDVVGDLRMLDRRVIEGSIPQMVDDAVSAVTANLRVHRTSRGAGASDDPEIPVDAVREAVVNALAHRDYSHLAAGDHVRVEMYPPDRVEVTSPGGIWGGRRPRDLFDGTSRSRNAILSKLLMEVPFTDRDETVSENAGSGVPRMAGSMRRAGLSVPRFLATVTGVTVHLDRHGVLDPETSRWLGSVGAGSLSRDEQVALALVRQGHPVDDQVLRHQLAMDGLDAVVLLRGLVRRGWLTAPARPGRPHRLGPTALADALGGYEAVDVPRSRDEEIVALVAARGSASAHEIAQGTDAAIGSVRNRLAALVRRGDLVATAPPTSRHRRYRMPEVEVRPAVRGRAAPSGGG